MLSGMLDAVRGCLKEEVRMDIISNNMSNSTVIGFKKKRISFMDLLQNSMSSHSGKNVSSDPSLLAIKTDYQQGDVRVTGNPLDFAINGKGFFKVMTPEGVRYTRKGNFQLDAEGYLVTQNGHRVLGGGGPIYISGSQVYVNGRGVILVDNEETGKIDVVDFENYDGMVLEGQCLLKNEAGSPEQSPSPETKIQQEYVELSNVNVAEEMIQMIHCLRAFESYQKAIQVLDGINNKVINDVSKLR